MEWGIEETFKVIKLYRQFPCLWDCESPYYKSIDKKKNAWEEISKNMSKSEDVIKKKIKNLRTAYFNVKKKVDSCNKNSGSSADDTYIPHLFYYNEMLFLEPSVNIRETKSNLNFSTEDSEFIEFTPIVNTTDERSLDDSPLWSESDTPVSKKRNFKRYKRDDKINSALDTIISQVLDEKETMFSCFGKSIGLQLEQMDLNLAMEAMADIQKLISEKMQGKQNHKKTKNNKFS